MISGRPRLAVWSLDETLRLFELGESGAGQIWSTSVTQNSSVVAESIFPYAEFSENAFFLAVAHGSSATNGILRTFQVSDGSLIVGTNINSPAVSRMGYVLGAFSRKKRHLIGTPKLLINAPNGGVQAYTETGTAASVQFPQFGFANVRSLAFAPDGFLFMNRTAEVRVVAPDTNNYANLSDSIALSHLSTLRCDKLAWSPNSQYLATINTELPAEPVTVLIRDEVEHLVQYGTIPNPAGVGAPISVAFNFDNRHVAVGYLNGSVYTTVIYARYGNIFIERQRFNGMGRLLTFTEDGSMLIDASAKMALEKGTNGLFSEKVGLLSALPDNIRSQALSPDVEFITSVSRFYDGVLADMIAGNVNTENLKLVLLSGGASFAASDNDVGQVTNSGEHEVFGDGWDQGGMVVEGVTIEARGADVAVMVAEDIETIIYRNPIQFRYAVLVDGDRPLIWTDFNQTVDVMENQKFSFDLQTLGIVTYSA